jgi:hypothetical protein
VDEGLRHCFPGHECHTCRYAGFKVLSNGKLLAAAEAAGFEVLVTFDQNMPNQQTLKASALSVVVLQPPSTTADDVLTLIPDVLAALESLRQGDFVRIRRS